MKIIYIGNLNFKTTEENLTEKFAQFGEVTSATIIKDKTSGLSKGFGFVEMPNDDEAEKAISGLKGRDIDGRKVRVSIAEDKPKRRASY
ncbi:MAG: RNA-binding protein [Treponema sp.]|nr:RNA-binding protein [Treponema sp.]